MVIFSYQPGNPNMSLRSPCTLKRKPQDPEQVIHDMTRTPKPCDQQCSAVHDRSNPTILRMCAHQPKAFDTRSVKRALKLRSNLLRQVLIQEGQFHPGPLHLTHGSAALPQKHRDLLT